MIDAFNINVIKQKEGKLEMLSNKVTKPKEIGVELNGKKEIYCANKDYEIREITKEKAKKILEDNNKNYSLWQEYMSGTEDRASSHLVGPNNEALY